MTAASTKAETGEDENPPPPAPSASSVSAGSLVSGTEGVERIVKPEVKVCSRHREIIAVNR
jgi:hypothetical protein